MAQKYIGINTAGYDSGDQASSGYSCVSTSQLEWLIKSSSMNIVRMPILPNRILKSLPTNDTVYNVDLFTEAWTNGNDLTNSCDTTNPYYPLSPYMSAVNSALRASDDAKVIINMHDNVKHLDSFGTTMTPENFVNFWRLIVQYINENVDTELQSNVYYELFNEPVGNIAGDWYTDYTVPAIQMILNTTVSTPIIYATTWNNYSGIHSWVQDGSLATLVSSLSAASISPDTVWIAGHQYCDSNFSGVAEAGCDASVFNEASYMTWITDTDNTIGDYNWFMTEGNVRCPEMTCPNSNLYIDFLQYILTDSKCKGFTVWMSNNGDDYGGTNMGNGSSVKEENFKIYSQLGLYETNEQTTAYDFFAQFLSSKIDYPIVLQNYLVNITNSSNEINLGKVDSSNLQIFPQYNNSFIQNWNFKLYTSLFPHQGDYFFVYDLSGANVDIINLKGKVRGTVNICDTALRAKRTISFTYVDRKIIFQLSQKKWDFRIKKETDLIMDIQINNFL